MGSTSGCRTKVFHDDPHYHGEGDIPERCDVPNAAQTVQVTLAALLTLDRTRDRD
jgi:hypothetical protein